MKSKSNCNIALAGLGIAEVFVAALKADQMLFLKVSSKKIAAAKSLCCLDTLGDVGDRVAHTAATLVPVSEVKQPALTPSFR